ncbi:MAG: PilZ domain-containing protein [Pyrinomonadaceae bacterium]|jgi:hypothetical protein|nr:PilZ domain-containing protein [Pyrinomonadaceae bacterium]
MEERRESERIDLRLLAQWETVFGVHEGTIVNCSVGGCFVQAQVEEPSTEPIKLSMQLPNGTDIHLWGNVVYYLPTLGFGVQFISASDEGQVMLIKWLDYLHTVHSSSHLQSADTKSAST